MSMEHLIKQLCEISEIVAAFNSEEVQIRIVEKLLPFLNVARKIPVPPAPESGGTGAMTQNNGLQRRRPPGPKRLLNGVMETSFFAEERSIKNVLDHLNGLGGEFTAPEISGILLNMVKDAKLQRYRSQQSKRYVYINVR